MKIFYLVYHISGTLFTHHVLSANSSQKSCIKSMRVILSRNRSESFNLLYLQECAFLSNCESIEYIY